MLTVLVGVLLNVETSRKKFVFTKFKDLKFLSGNV